MEGSSRKFFFLELFFLLARGRSGRRRLSGRGVRFPGWAFFSSPLFFLKFEKYLSRGSSSGAVNANALVKHSEKYLAAGVKNDSPN